MALHTVTPPANTDGVPSRLQALMCALSSSGRKECFYSALSLEPAVPVLPQDGRHNSTDLGNQGTVLGTLFFLFLFYPTPISPRRPQTWVGWGEGTGSSLEPGSHFRAQSLSLCGKLLKVIKHPEVVKCAVNEVLINTPQEKIKRHH